MTDFEQILPARPGKGQDFAISRFFREKFGKVPEMAYFSSAYETDSTGKLIRNNWN